MNDGVIVAYISQYYHSNATILLSKKSGVFVKFSMKEPTGSYRILHFFSYINGYILIEYVPWLCLKSQKERIQILYESVMLYAACCLICWPIHNSIIQLSATGSALLNGLFLVDHLLNYRSLTVSSTPATNTWNIHSFPRMSPWPETAFLLNTVWWFVLLNSCMQLHSRTKCSVSYD